MAQRIGRATGRRADDQGDRAGRIAFGDRFGDAEESGEDGEAVGLAFDGFFKEITDKASITESTIAI